MLEINDIGITNQKLINNEIHNFYESLFKKTIQKTQLEIKAFFDKISVPQISSDQLTKCNNKITELELTNALKNISSRKIPGNDR